MNMKRLLTLVAFFATLQASAQQVNPVPDYVFANRMSAGRNTVTDTAAYFSIGPRYGATRGMMPPMVVDTASFSANKRNGLLIFSVQKNKFLYWDSVGVKWAEMAGTAGTALTSADTAALLSTRAWRQKGIDSLAALRISGSGTTGYIPRFTTATSLGNSAISNIATNVGIGTTSPTYNLDINGTLRSVNGADFATTSGNVGIGTTSPAEKLDVTSTLSRIVITSTTNSNNSGLYFNAKNSGGTNVQGGVYFIPGATPYLTFSGNNSGTHLNVTSAGEVLINTTSDAGDYKLQVFGNVYNTGSITTGAPSGGSIKPWKIGEAATVSPTSPNRTIRVEIDGVVYYLHAKTTND